MYVVTLSATFGAGGKVIGPALAERLGVPFFDRAIPAAVAKDLGIPLEHAESRDEQVRGWLARMMASVAPLSTDSWAAAAPPLTARLSDTEFIECTRAAIRKIISTEGGVILGRAAALVLREHPGALHVRLDGDPQRRVRQVMEQLGLSEPQAQDTMTKIDTATTEYVRHFYGTDLASFEHYHLMLDSTRLPPQVCTEIIVTAAKSAYPVG